MTSNIESLIPELLTMEKSPQYKLNEIKKNIILMLINRNFIDKANEEKYTKKLIDDMNDEQEYIINIDNITNYNTTISSKRIYLKIFDYKINSINKNSPIGEFITKFYNEYKIILVEDINQKSENIIENYKTPCEIFKNNQLMINIVDHVMVPKHEILSQEQGEQVLQTYCARKKDMPLISTSDPVAKYYNIKIGNIVRITRPSSMTVESIFYRIAVKINLTKAKT